jgi:hypothetical protein
MNTNQEKEKADRMNDREYGKQMLAEMKADREKIQAETEVIRAETEAIRAETEAIRDKRMEANRESDQEELKGMTNVTQERIDANTKEMNAKIDAN